MKKNTYIYIALAVAAVAGVWFFVYMKNKKAATRTNYAAGELDPVPNPMSGESGASVGAAAGIGMEAASAT
jgi:bacteriorhodopsin